jgi:predicted ATP-binding protein involved in virulence
MRIERLQLENFRGFAELDLRFPKEGPAVFIGKNGAGKSSVLDAIAMFLSTFTSKLRRYAVQMPIPMRDIRHAAPTGSVRATLTIGVHGKPLRWSLSRTRPRSTTYADISQYATQIRERGLGPDESIPILCYYRSNRGFGGIEPPPSKSPPELPFPQLYAYKRAFGGLGGPFQNFVRWFRFEEDSENELRLRKDPAYRSNQLEGVRRAIKGVMSVLQPGDFTDLRVERPKSKNGVGFPVHTEASLLIDKQGQSLTLDQLSDGEKTTLLLAADLAMRLAIANPGLDDPLRGEGIVLIDELELHLHPEWQRAVLPALCSTFPGCQFIVTTHSPQVLSQMKPESVIILEDFRRIEATPSTYGRDSNSILEDVMGVSSRPREAADKIHHIARLIDDDDFESAKREIHELSKWLGENDSEIVHLNTVLKFMRD